MRRRRPLFWLSFTLLALSGCATTTTRPPEIDPALVRLEQQRQRELVLTGLLDQQRRLDGIAYPLLQGARPLCGEHERPWPGFRALTASDFTPEWQSAARATYRMGDTLQVFAVVPGGPADRTGLRAGDRLHRVGGHVAGRGRGAASALDRFLREALPALDTLEVEVERDGRRRILRIPLEPVCAYEAVVVPSMALNAFADGRGVYLTTAMMRFAEDHEVAAILAHEMAHNAMGHIAAEARNSAVGSFFGLLADILTLAAGDTLPDEPNTVYYGAMGATAHSRDFEREADYVGLYILALSGRPLESAPFIFRQFAIAEPETIAYAATHPTHAERFLLMEATIAEIERKRAAGEPLRPERKQVRRGGDGTVHDEVPSPERRIEPPLP